MSVGSAASSPRPRDGDAGAAATAVAPAAAPSVVDAACCVLLVCRGPLCHENVLRLMRFAGPTSFGAVGASAVPPTGSSLDELPTPLSSSLALLEALLDLLKERFLLMAAPAELRFFGSSGGDGSGGGCAAAVGGATAGAGAFGLREKLRTRFVMRSMANELRRPFELRTGAERDRRLLFHLLDQTNCGLALVATTCFFCAL